MIVQRLTVATRPLLAMLSAFLGMLPLPAPPYAQVGDWRRDVTGGPPSVDRPRPLTFRREPLLARPSTRTLATLVRSRLPAGTTISALNYYPAGGAGLGWHTDSANPGWRIYIAQPLTEVAGEFLTADEIIADAPGVALAFEVGAPESWHAVRTEGPRLSIGIRIRERAQLELLGLA